MNTPLKYDVKVTAAEADKVDILALSLRGHLRWQAHESTLSLRGRGRREDTAQGMARGRARARDRERVGGNTSFGLSMQRIATNP